MPKRILILVSNPEGTTALNLPRELRKLQEAVRRSQQRDYFEVELQFAATETDLRRHILDVRPQIVHFCGHGTTQGLVLEDDHGRAKVVSNEFLTSLLHDFADRIECVLLNACDTEPLTDALAAHLNYVIGMGQPVRDDAAIAFAEAFYDALGAGETYEKAFEIGRTAVLGEAGSRDAKSRKATVVDQDGNPVQAQNQEHRIPVLKVNPNPRPIQAFWLAPEAERQAVRDLLTAIDDGFNTIRLFHTREPIVLKDQYIPVQVTLERRYRHTVETIGGYAESESELKRLYAMKGSGEEKIEEEIKRQQVDWQEARKQESRIVVLADPGMGKSTLLRREVGQTVQQAMEEIEQGRALSEITIPYLIRLSTLADELEQMSVEEAILQIMQERHSPLLKHHESAMFLNEFLKRQLLGGKVLLLLDALDEVPDRQRPKLLEKLNEFAKTCPIIGTSRIVGYGGRLVDGAKDMEIVPFTQPQIEQYIAKWFENAQDSLTDQSVTARGLIQALRERPQIAGLAQNPLLLSLICSLYQHDKLTLPARRSQIYEQAVTCMLSEWVQTRLHPQGNPDHLKEAKTRLLEALAYHFTCEGREVFDYADLYDWVEAYLEADAPRDLRDAKTAELIAELSEEDGILQKLYRDRSDNQYLFLHRTFQEYFTASYLKRAIKKNKQNPAYVTELVQTYCWNYDWHETLTLLAGLLENPMPLIEAIAAQKDDIFQTQLLLAGRCVAECRELSHPLVDEIVDRVYQFWLKYPDAEFIRAVVVVLGQTQSEIVEALRVHLERKILHGVDKIDIDKVIQVLKDIGNEKATDILIFAISNQDSGIGCIAAEALGKIGNKKAVDALILAFLNQNEDDEINKRSALALGRIGNEKTVGVLVSALSNENWIIRRCAAEALGDVDRKEDNEEIIDALISALADQKSSVKRLAAKALGKTGNEKAIDALIQVLSDENFHVQFSAAEALSKLGHEKSIDILIPGLFNQENADIRHRATWALRSIGKEKAVNALLLALDDQNLDAKRRAAESLAKLGDKRGLNTLILSLSHPNPDVRSGVVIALWNIATEEVTDDLIRAFSDQNPYVRGNSARVLGKIGSEKSISTLVLGLSDQHPYVRSNVVQALEKIDSQETINKLLLMLSEKESYILYYVARLLINLGSISDLEKLLTLPNLSLEDVEVFSLARTWAIRFSKSGSPFIPVYPEVILIQPQQEEQTQKSWFSRLISKWLA